MATLSPTFGLQSQNLALNNAGSTTVPNYIKTNPGGLVGTGINTQMNPATYSTKLSAPLLPNTVLGTKASSPNATVSAPNTTLPSSQVLSSNLSGAGKTQTSAIPPGYSYDAKGNLTNAQGQLYVPPTQAAPQNNSVGAGVNTSINQPAPSTNPYTNTGAPTYSGLVGSLAATAANPTAGFTTAQNTAQTAATSLLNSAPQQNADVISAKNAIQKLQDQYATQRGNIDMTPGDLSLANGEQGALYNRYSGQLGALEAGLQNTLQSNEQQQAAFTGAGNLANTTSGTATGQQNAQQSGLNNAASLAQPVQVPYNNQFLNPTNGQPVGNSSYSLQSAAQNYAQMVQNGQMSYNDAVSALGGYGVAGQQALNSSLPQGFNVNQSNATAGSQTSQTQAQQQYQSSAQQAKNLGLQLQQVINQAGINPSDVNKVNAFVQGIANNTSDPNYATFQNLVNDMASTYANVLTPPGGTTTDMVRQISSSLLNSTQSGQSILQVMQNLDAQVQAKIAGVTTAYGTNNTNTGSTSQPAGWF